MPKKTKKQIALNIFKENSLLIVSVCAFCVPITILLIKKIYKFEQKFLKVNKLIKTNVQNK